MIQRAVRVAVSFEHDGWPFEIGDMGWETEVSGHIIWIRAANDPHGIAHRRLSTKYDHVVSGGRGWSLHEHINCVETIPSDDPELLRALLAGI